MLRKAKVTDIPKIEDMARASFGQLLAADYPARTITAALPVIARVTPDFIAQARYMVWDVDGQIVGGAGWSLCDGGADVRKVAVHPDHLRMGVGRALMAAIEADARSEGQHGDLRCASSLSAVRFYEACGFVRVGVDQIETPLDGVVFDIVLLRKTL